MTLSPAERAARYRARKRGQPVPKLKPGPQPQSLRGLRERNAELENSLRAYKRAYESAAKEARDRRLRPSRRLVENLEELQDLRERNAELEHLLRTGYRPGSPPSGPALPLSADQYDELLRAKRDDDMDLAREVLLDAWDTWKP